MFPFTNSHGIIRNITEGGCLMSEKILTQILQELSRVHQRFDEIDKRFEIIDERFDEIDKRFESIDERFKSVDQRFAEMNQRFNHLDTEMKQFREETRAEFQVLKGGQVGLRKEITDRFHEVKIRLEHHDQTYEILNRRQLNLETDLELLKKR